MVNSKSKIDKCKFQDSEPPGDHADDSANFLHLIEKYFPMFLNGNRLNLYVLLQLSNCKQFKLTYTAFYKFLKQYYRYNQLYVIAGFKNFKKSKFL